MMLLETVGICQVSNQSIPVGSFRYVEIFFIYKYQISIKKKKKKFFLVFLFVLISSDT